VRALERQFNSTYATSPSRDIRQLRVRMSCHALVYSRKTLAQSPAVDHPTPDAILINLTGPISPEGRSTASGL